MVTLGVVRPGIKPAGSVRVAVGPAVGGRTVDCGTDGATGNGLGGVDTAGSAGAVGADGTLGSDLPLTLGGSGTGVVGTVGMLGTAGSPGDGGSGGKAGAAAPTGLARNAPPSMFGGGSVCPPAWLTPFGPATAGA